MSRRRSYARPQAELPDLLAIQYGERRYQRLRLPKSRPIEAAPAGWWVTVTDAAHITAVICAIVAGAQVLVALALRGWP